MKQHSHISGRGQGAHDRKKKVAATPRKPLRAAIASRAILASSTAGISRPVLPLLAATHCPPPPSSPPLPPPAKRLPFGARAAAQQLSGKSDLNLN